MLFTAFALTGCNNQGVQAGTVVDKTIGEPLLFSLGQLKVIDPRPQATDYCIWVKPFGSDKIAKFYVSESTYNTYSIGDNFEFNTYIHFAA